MPNAVGLLKGALGFGGVFRPEDYGLPSYEDWKKNSPIDTSYDAWDLGATAEQSAGGLAASQLQDTALSGFSSEALQVGYGAIPLAGVNDLSRGDRYDENWYNTTSAMRLKLEHPEWGLHAPWEGNLNPLAPVGAGAMSGLGDAIFNSLGFGEAAASESAGAIVGAGGGPTGLITDLPGFSGPLTASQLLGTGVSQVVSAGVGSVGVDEIVDVIGTRSATSLPSVAGGAATTLLGAGGVGLPTVDETVTVTGTRPDTTLPSVTGMGTGVAGELLGLDTTLPDAGNPLTEDQLTQPADQDTPGLPISPTTVATAATTLLGVAGVLPTDTPADVPITDPVMPAEPDMGAGGTSESSAILNRLGYFRAGKGDRYQMLAFPTRKARETLLGYATGA